MYIFFNFNSNSNSNYNYNLNTNYLFIVSIRKNNKHLKINEIIVVSFNYD